MKANRWALLLILLVAVCTRFYHLGSNPPALDWDEVSLGYNAYSLLKTGQDEYGNSWPLSIRSFNDYKPPLYAYLTIPSVAVLGLTETAVRLPSAIAGVVAVVAIYFIARELSRKSAFSQTFSLISALVLAISPWHLQFSRAAFEANVALTCYLIALATYFYWRNQKNKQMIWLVVSATSAVAALYAYHSARLVVPLLFLGLGLFDIKTLWQQKKQVIVSVLLAITLVSPLLYISLRGHTSQRFSTVSVFTNPGEFSRESERIQRYRQFKQDYPVVGKFLYNQKVVYGWIILRNYFEHFNLDFLFLESDSNPRHHAYGFGLLYLIELPILLFGVYQALNGKKVAAISICLITLVGPAASALTASTPHAIRGFMMLPGLVLFISWGIVVGWRLLQTQKISSLAKRGIGLSFISVYVLHFLVYLNAYYVLSPYYFAKDWQYGYKQLVEKVSALEASYDQILITNYYDQPHIYFAFYQQIDPSIYQTYSETAFMEIGKYQFKRLDDQADFNRPNTLIAVEPDRTPSNATIIDTISFVNDTVAFNLIESN